MHYQIFFDIFCKPTTTQLILWSTWRKRYHEFCKTERTEMNSRMTSFDTASEDSRFQTAAHTSASVIARRISPRTLPFLADRHRYALISQPFDLTMLVLFGLLGRQPS